MPANLKSTIRIYLLVVFCMALVGTTAPAFAQPASEDLSAKVDAYINETMRRLPIPGLAVGIVRGDQALYLHGYGTANTNGDPVTPQTPFTLQSVTKTFTALAIHQLVDAGRINFDEPVRTYIPEFRLADQNASASITMRQLLDHTSGISRTEGEERYLQSPKLTFDEAMKKLAHFKPEYKPGEHYEYSNWNYVLLGEVIARASGEPYAEYMQKNILDPLEMPHASFADHHTVPGSATGNLIVFGISVPYDEKYVPALLGAANLSASAEEMTHYLIPYFNQGGFHGRDLLPAEGQGWYDDCWNWHGGQPADISNSFSGAHNATQSNITIFPLQKVGVVVLMNTRLDQLSPTAPGAWDIAFNIARITMDSPYELPSNRGFYTSWAIVDGLLLLLIASIIWQASRLKNWRNQYQTAPRPKRTITWVGIMLDFLIGVAILVLPNLVNSRWSILLYHRPDFAVPLLTIGLSLGVLGLIKVAKSRT